MWFLLGISVCLVFSTVVSAVEVSVVWNEKYQSYELVKGVARNFVSVADYKNDINSTGWSYLEIKSNPKYNDTDQAYTAGLIEGLLTSDLIKMHWYNTFDGYCKKPLSGYCQRLQNFIEVNFEWMSEQIFLLGNSDPFWHQVQLVLAQLQGLLDGYGFQQTQKLKLSKVSFKPDVTGLFALNGIEERRIRGHVVGSGSCSALVKLLPGNKDLYVSQDTWNGFQSMLRILKKYDLGYHTITGGPIVPGQAMTFSSYPGIQMSGDDFYVISTGLVTQETTIGNNNSSRWSLIKPQSVLEGIRNMVANRLATSGSQWVEQFSRYNSGTYNNQWMVVDFNRFVAQSPSLNDWLLFVLEQIPGMIMSRDATDVLRKQSYWPSYNSASFPEIFNASGGQENVAKYGDWFSYDRTPRANIFRRDHSKVVDVNSMTRLMRYNDYTHDPLSACNCTPPYSAENAISARCDLNPANGTYPFGALGHRSHGGTDMKLTTSALIKDLEFIAISGPTYDSLPPFQWSKSDFRDSVRHVGHPDLWVFKPVQHKWK